MHCVCTMSLNHVSSLAKRDYCKSAALGGIYESAYMYKGSWIEQKGRYRGEASVMLLAEAVETDLKTGDGVERCAPTRADNEDKLHLLISIFSISLALLGIKRQVARMCRFHRRACQGLAPRPRYGWGCK